MTFLGVTPYLYYADAAAAVEWLTRVFGFVEEVRDVDPAGAVAEVELAVGEARVMLSGGRTPGPEEGSGQLLIVHVEDVDAQHARVTDEGVDAEPPEDEPYGARIFSLTDPWGYRWSFWQHTGEFDLAEGWQTIRG